MIRVLIADDSNAILDGLCALLCPECGFEVVGVARDGLEALEKAKELLPDVVLMDAQMPNMDGVEATRQIKQSLPDMGILFFSVFSNHLEAHPLPIVEGPGADLLAHPILGNHSPGHPVGILEVIGGAGGYIAEDSNTIHVGHLRIHDYHVGQ